MICYCGEYGGGAHTLAARCERPKSEPWDKDPRRVPVSGDTWCEKCGYEPDACRCSARDAAVEL